MSSLPTHRKIVMARNIAAKYLRSAAIPEFRLTILLNGTDTRNVQGMITGLRDGRIRIGGVPLSAFEVRENFDSISVWSSDESSICKVAAWFEFRGFETSGVH